MISPIKNCNYSYLNSIGTAVPDNQIEQTDIADFMAETLELNDCDQKQLKVLYRASGIRSRFSVIEDFKPEKEKHYFVKSNFPKISDRMQMYQQEAPKLALKAINNCLDKADSISPKEITHLITVSCTGMYAPGLGIQLIDELGLNSTVHRTAINFMGCYGAFNGLKTADYICKADNNAKVLVVCVELCTIHFQDSSSPDDLLAGALFSDGAAAVLIQSAPLKNKPALQINNFFCDLYPDGKNDMSWQIGNFGFEMRLSSYVPALLGKGINNLLNNLLSNASVKREEIDLFAIHPGGKRILEVIEENLEINRDQDKFAFDVLKKYGNMSSVTILFVLEALLKQESNSESIKNIIAMAFGPGLTIESSYMQLIPPD
ncbi:type III polyketide synthase [Chondrinema litorale]|uniref:type III polyketide synthase n=1 Tax=Chondrinema litorale TaxID=2994555 RepID=UPI0025431FD1|nr:type III polyketide synthase [Chondrinema litorale]UZR94504.1 type III polyketide synthase [Chondrinema litorale]